MEVKTLGNYLTLLLFELAGTALLTLGYNFGYRRSHSVNSYSPDVIAAGLFVSVLITKRVSGSHLNAGITLSVCIIEKVNEDTRKLRIASAYVIGQILGAMLGMAIAYGILGYDSSMDISPYDL